MSNFISYFVKVGRSIKTWFNISTVIDRLQKNNDILVEKYEKNLEENRKIVSDINKLDNDLKKIVSDVNKLDNDINKLKYNIYNNGFWLKNNVINIQKQITEKFMSLDFIHDERSVMKSFNEYNFLNSINIPLLCRYIFEDKKAVYCVIGHYASSFSDEVPNISTYTLSNSYNITGFSGESYGINPNSIVDILSKRDSIIILNPAFSISLLRSGRIFSFYNKAKSKIVLLMQNYFPENKLGIIWDNGFSLYEGGGAQPYFRWYEGENNQAKIYIYNNVTYGIRCSIDFDIWTLSETDIYCSVCEYCSSIHLKKSENDKEEKIIYGHVNISAMLQSGLNQLNLCFEGEPSEVNGRKLKFAVSNLKIRKEDMTLEGFDLYKTSANMVNTDYIMQDSVVRSILHQSGFFEVESRICSKFSDNFEKHIISRPDYEALHKYYIKEENTLNIQDGAIVYIARRKGVPEI
jgi:hypothetical protein